ncbi:O-methyltransferase [Bacteroidia bacterium]|nr:O-methyltransferase [Bacteroidia bacterium]
MNYYDFDNITIPEINIYAENHTTEANDILNAVEKMTALNTVNVRMISGKLVCSILHFLCKMQRPKNALEIGVFTGYSSIAIASALSENAKLISIENNPEYENFIIKNINDANLSHKIDLKIGDAKNIIPSLDNNFDFIYLDADKQSYSYYYDILIDKLNQNGLLIADNVLWSGKILEENSSNKDIIALREFNDKVNADKRVDNILLPIKDGLMIVRKN